MTRRQVLLSLYQPDFPDIRTVPPDLALPPTFETNPSPGIRMKQKDREYRDTQVHHLLYLPTDWHPDRRYPVIVEYAGNGNYRNEYGDVSLGLPEGSNLGYGASGGRGYIWLCLPSISPDRLKNQILWWGDVPATIDYCLRTVDRVCRDYGGDPNRLILAGFSRGSIACNYLGLHNDQIAKLWRAFICYSHYDGVRTNWPFPGAADRNAALERLHRLRGRPQFICHERSVAETRDYIQSTGVQGRFEFHDLPFRNHNDAWTLRDIPLRRALRNWLTNI